MEFADIIRWMPELTDYELLVDFARSEAEEAFATLVERYVNLVYSTALRFTGNSHHAEEITQAVFIILARKAGKISPRVVLSGWLYQTTRLTAANFVKGEVRRQRREQEAYMQSTLNEPDSAEWQQIAPMLDDAMGSLSEADRNAVVLRFFENKTAAQVALALNVSEAAAHKRTTRSLEKLRKLFAKRGVSSTTAIIGKEIFTHSIQTAPVALAKTVTAVSIAKGAAASGSILGLVKGGLKIMAWIKMKTAIVAGAVVLLAVSTTTITVKEIQEHRTYPWQVPPPIDFALLKQIPPQVRIVPTKFPHIEGFYRDQVNVISDGEKVLGIAVDLTNLLQMAYQRFPSREIFPAGSSGQKYDCIANLPKGSSLALQREIERKFGLVGTRQMREMNVLLLKVKFPNARGLNPSTTQHYESKLEYDYNHVELKRQPLTFLATVLEGSYFKIPVIDRTGLAGPFDVTLKWDFTTWSDLDPLKESLLDQLGLELVPSTEPIEMLIVEKVK